MPTSSGSKPTRSASSGRSWSSWRIRSSIPSRARLLNNVWDLSHGPGPKVVDVYVRYLRQKIDPEGAVPLIQTVRGFGYMIAAPANGSGPNRNGDGR